MKEIEFSFMVAREDEAQRLVPLMDEFEKEFLIHVHLTPILWENAWTQNVKYALYKHGPDVSAVGVSWIASLASMQALHPFTPAEVQSLGGANAYFEPLWQAGQLLNNPAIWAIPWLGDVRVIYFWKDILLEAGIEDFDAAFKSDAALVETLRTLQQHGYPHPLAITTQPIAQVLHESAHWIWQAGGDFTSQDGKRVTFNDAAAFEGLTKYFSLHPFVSPETTPRAPGALFNERTSPVHISGLWVPESVPNPQLREKLGVAKLPEPAYIGGSSLVIWNYSPNNQPAFELIRFLSSKPIFYNQNSQAYNQLPTRRESLDIPMTVNNPFNRTFMQAFQSGRSFPALRLWGSIEDKLTPVLASIWSELFAHPDQDLDALLHRRIDPLAERLNIVLE